MRERIPAKKENAVEENRTEATEAVTEEKSLADTGDVKTQESVTGLAETTAAAETVEQTEESDTTNGEEENELLSD